MLIYVPIPLRFSSASCKLWPLFLDPPCIQPLSRHSLTFHLLLPILLFLGLCSIFLCRFFLSWCFIGRWLISASAFAFVYCSLPSVWYHVGYLYEEGKRCVCAYQDWEASRSPLYLEWNIVSKSECCFCFFLNRQNLLWVRSRKL